MKKNAKIYVAGHKGLVGSAIVRRLLAEGYDNLLLAPRSFIDLRDQAATSSFFAREKPEYVFLAAAKVGGIMANSMYPAQFIHDNLMISANVVDAAWRNGCKKLLFLGSSCIYPKYAAQPIKENSLLTGLLEPTNEGYALAKIVGIRLGQMYRRQYGFDAISAMPCNLYGPGDNFHPENSHVLPALIRKFDEAKNRNLMEVIIWGSGKPLREFLHVDDMAAACVFLMENYSAESHVNVGSGEEISIANLALMVADIIGYKGKIVYDGSKPDGTPRKVMDSSFLAATGWKPKISLYDGIRQTYEWYKSQAELRK